MSIEQKHSLEELAILLSGKKFFKLPLIDKEIWLCRLQQLWAQRREAHANLYTSLEDVLASSRDMAVQHQRVSEILGSAKNAALFDVQNAVLPSNLFLSVL